MYQVNVKLRVGHFDLGFRQRLDNDCVEFVDDPAGFLVIQRVSSLIADGPCTFANE